MSLELSASPTRSLAPLSPNAATIALTPRSKVKAMLATFDDDDEDDDNGTDKENNTPVAISHHADTKKPAPPQSPSFTNDQNSGVAKTASPLSLPHSDDNLVSEPDEDDDDVVIPRPRKGTLAARMQTNTPRALSDGESPEDGEAAYERVKRKIFASKAQSQDSPGTTPKEQKQEDQERGLSDDDDELGSPDELSRKEGTQREIHSASGTPPQSPSSQTSPGLFISPERPSAGIENRASGTSLDSDGAAQAPNKIGNRLQALLERKRLEIKERDEKNGREVAQESEDDSDESVSASQPPKKTRTEVLRAESEDDDDREVGRKLTQQARPTRKASKKALEEMNRETQRLSRNMQLTHEARTKKKFPVADFLAKFNHKQPANADQTVPAPSSSSVPGSPDAESAPSPDTAPSSPPSLGQTPEKATNLANGTAAAKASEALLEQDEAAENEELPDLNSLLTQAANGSTHGNTPPQSNKDVEDKTAEPTSKRYSAKRFAKSAKPVRAAADSDDDLEIVMTAQPSRLPVFDNLPTAKARESGSMHALRALAQLNDTEKPQNRGKKSMSRAELDALNRRRAREQAKIERDEKIQRLREKGVLVQSAEEKEQEQMQLENMLERARKEAEEIAKREKEAAKKEGKADDDDFPDSEDEDEEYQASDEEEEEEEVQLSGSEDEVEGDDADEEDDVERSDEEEVEEADAPNSLLDNEAADGSDEEETAEAQAEEEMEDGADLASEEDATQEHARVEFSRQKVRRKRVVVSDDEVEEEVSVTTQTGLPLPQATTPKQPSSDAFGFTTAKPAGLGLSQFFAGTMAESQTQAEDDAEIDSQQDSLAFLRGIPPPDLPDFTTPQTVESPNVRIRDSQVEETPTHRQSQLSGPVNFDTQTQTAFFETLISEMPDPSQDVGFQVGDSQAPVMNPTFSTVDTQPLAGSIDEEPQRKRGRLVRKTDARENPDNGGDIEETPDTKVTEPSNFFDVMRDAAKRPVTVDEFDKKKSEAKGMVEEQAEESEDEYAGLGGASDDESTGDVDEETKRMIDDDDNAATNSRDIAAYYAEKERLEDEKGIEKLYKDVINGGLRRKRGAQDDLWESDDEDEIVARRRLAKQREFAKMRKALLADEKLGKIAANPKQQAFLQTVEDRDDNDDFDFLDQPQDDVSQVTDSQSDTLQRQRPLSTVSANAQKRKYSDFEDVGGSQEENRPPPNLRRTTKATRPTSLADIRNTLSEIIGEPESILESQSLFFESPAQSEDEFEADADGDDEAEATDDDELYRRPSETEMLPPPVPASQLASKASPRNRRRTAPSVARSTVIDRMALKRSASSSTTTSTSSSDRLAFHAPAKAAYAGFRVPSLLRRATTNSSTMSTSSTSTSASEASGGLGGKESVKMGGTKKSSVNYYVREKERRAKVEQVERERQEGRERVGKMRRSVVAGGIGALTGGNFE